MTNFVSVPYNNKMVKAEEVEVSESSEQWSEFTLKDGTKIRAKVSITSIYKLADQKDPLGNDIYSINANPIISLVLPFSN